MTKIVNYPYLSSFSESFNNMVKTCRTNKDREMCGIVGGKIGNIFECIFVSNVHQDPNAYTMNPEELSKALDLLDEKGYELIALFHSHLGDSSMPSGIDLDLKSIDVPMIIVSQKEIKAWRFKDDKTYEEVKLAIYNPPARASVGAIKALQNDGLRITLEVSGKVFEELPQILKSFFANRNGRAWEDRLGDLHQLLQLVRMGQSGIQVGDNPDSIVARIIQDEQSNDRLRRLVDNELDSGLIAHGLIQEGQQLSRHRPARVTAEGAVISNVTLQGLGIATNRDATTITPLGHAPEPKRQVPPHPHRYKKVSKTPEGSTTFECTFEGCDKTLTVDGEFEDVIKESKINAIGAEFKTIGDEGHGEPAKGEDTAGEGTGPDAGQAPGGPG